MKGIDFQYAGRPSSIERDLYDYEHRVDGVVELLDECSLPFVLAVDGEWGRGKSTFVNMLLERIQTHEEDPDRSWQIVRYHPWRYDIQEFDDAWESLVEILQAELGQAQSWGKGVEELFDLLARNRWTRLMWKVGVSVGGIVPGGAGVVGGIEQLAKGIEDVFQNPARLGPRYMLFEKIRRKINELTTEKRVLLVIDDLDRCTPLAVCHLLRCIPTLFAPEKDGPKITVLLAIDPTATRDALVIGQGLDQGQAEGLLEKLINVHITLPILQLGRGDEAIAMKNIIEAITATGHRRENTIQLGTEFLDYKIRSDQIEAIVRFMSYNPRKLDRFCLLFDLKWKSRFRSNSQVFLDKLNRGQQLFDHQTWLNRFRDRLIWETIIELRWPDYDAKIGDLHANQEAIQQAIRGESPNAKGLPCEDFLDDTDFIEIHRIRDEWSKETDAG
jgi:hypothetical protein